MKVQSSTSSSNDATAYGALMQHMERYFAMLEASAGAGNAGYGNAGYGSSGYGADGTSYSKGGYAQSPLAPKGMPIDGDAALKLGFGIGAAYAMAILDKYGKKGASSDKHCPTCSCGEHGKAGGLEKRLGYGKEKAVERNQEKRPQGDNGYGYN